MDIKNTFKNLSEKLRNSAKTVGSLWEKLRAKKSYMTLALIVLLIFAALITVCVRSCSNKKAPDSQLLAYYSGDSDSTYIYSSDGISTLLVSGKAIQTEISPNGKFAAALDQNGNLYLYSSGTVSFITDGVTSFVLSVDGDALLYRNVSGELYRFREKNAIKEKIADAAEESSFRISPDGLSVIFRTNGGQLVFSSGTSRIQIGDYHPISVSDKGKIIYLCDSESRLYVSLKGDSPGRLSSTAISGTPILNRTLTDLLYFSDGENYLTVYGATPKKLAGSEPITKLDSIITKNSCDAISVMRDAAFAARRFISGDSAYTITQDHKASPIITGKASIAFFGDKTYYIDNASLFATDSTTPIAESVSDFAFAKNVLFYIDVKGDLIAGKTDYSRLAYDAYEIIPFNSGVLIALDKNNSGDFTLYFSEAQDKLLKIGESCIFSIDIMHFR